MSGHWIWKEPSGYAAPPKSMVPNLAHFVPDILKKIDDACWASWHHMIRCFDLVQPTSSDFEEFLGFQSISTQSWVRKKCTTSETRKSLPATLKNFPTTSHNNFSWTAASAVEPSLGFREKTVRWRSIWRRVDGWTVGGRGGKPLRGERLQGFTPRNENEQNFVGSKMLHILFWRLLRPSFRNIMMFVSGSVWFNKNGCQKMFYTL